MGKKEKSHSISDSGADENIKVIVRCRPLSNREIEQGYKSCVDLDLADNTVTVHTLCGNPDRWTFDAVINNSYAQRDVFTQYIRPMVDSVLEGFNATVFAYGQSGSGKTHTMTGKMGDPEHEGIIPRTLGYIFLLLRQFHQTAPNKRFSLYVSFIELYNGKVRDLLAKQQVPLAVKENKDKTFYVQGAHFPQVKTPEDILSLMEEGTERRQVATTELNADSSRSHSIFSIVIECTETSEDGDARSITSKLNLVDLAGSERQSKTGATGDTLKEGCNINLSLSALGTVIDTLVKGRGHVPFRSSPLTMLLKDSLGGSSKTAMFANIGPSEHNISETISTLRFADRAKQIKNKPVVNMDTKDQKIAELTEVVLELKEKLKQYETGGLKQLEIDNEELRERVGALEVDLDNAIKSREADEVDFETHKQQWELERQELAETLNSIRSEHQRLLQDAQISDTFGADERRQKEEILRLCSEFLLAESQQQAEEEEGPPDQSSAEDGTPSRRKRRSGSSSGGGGGDGGGSGGKGAVIRDVDELAKLLRERSHGANGADQSKAASALHSLEAEHRALLKQLNDTQTELQRSVDEAKAEATTAAKKLKKAKELLHEEREARKQMALLSSGGGGGGVAGVATTASLSVGGEPASSPMRHPTNSGGNVQSASESAAALQAAESVGVAEERHRHQIHVLELKVKELYEALDNHPRLVEMEEAHNARVHELESRLAMAQSEADVARAAVVAPSSDDSKQVANLKRLIAAQEEAAAHNRQHADDLEALVASLKDNQRNLERQYTLKHVASSSGEGVAPLVATTSRSSTTAAKQSEHPRKKAPAKKQPPGQKKDDAKIREHNATGGSDSNVVEEAEEEDVPAVADERATPREEALNLGALEAKLHKDQRDKLREALDTTAHQRNLLLMEALSDTGGSGDNSNDDNGGDGGTASKNAQSHIAALTEENERLRLQYLETLRLMDDKQTSQLLLAVERQRAELRSSEDATNELEQLRSAVRRLQAQLDKTRLEAADKEAQLLNSVEQALSRKRSVKKRHGSARSRQHQQGSGVADATGTDHNANATIHTTTAAPGVDAHEHHHSHGDEEGATTSQQLPSCASPGGTAPRRYAPHRPTASDDDDDDDEANESPMKSLVMMLQRDKAQLLSEVSRMERALLMHQITVEDDAEEAEAAAAGNAGEALPPSATTTNNDDGPTTRNTAPRGNKSRVDGTSPSAGGGAADPMRASGGDQPVRRSGSLAQLLASDQQRSAAETELRQRVNVLEIERAQHDNDIETILSELEEERERQRQLESSRQLILEEVKQLRAELADRERVYASMENTLHEQQAEMARVRRDAADHTEQVEGLERRLTERSDQLNELRSILSQQKQLLADTQARSDEAVKQVKELQRVAADKDRQHMANLQEREEAVLRATNRRIEALADEHHRDLNRKDEEAQKIKKKLRKVEGQLQKAKEKFDEKVCEYEELSNILEEQKVESMKLLMRVQQGGGADPDHVEVQDQQEAIQSTLQRAKDEQRRKKDKFSMGETTSALSQVRAAGNAVNLVKKMGHVVVQPPSNSSFHTTAQTGGGDYDDHHPRRRQGAKTEDRSSDDDY